MDRLALLACVLASGACGRIGFDPGSSGDAIGDGIVTGDGATIPCSATASPRVNYRSISPSAATFSGLATIDGGTCTLVFPTQIPQAVGPGDRVTIGGETLYMRARDPMNANAIILDYPAATSHVTDMATVARAYPNMQAWETDREGDLVAEDRAEVGVARRDASFAANLVIDGSITDATHTITLTGHERHHGRINTGVVMDGQSTVCQGINVDDDFVTIEHLELARFNPDAGCGPAAIVVAAQNTLVRNVLAYDFDTSVSNGSCLLRLSASGNASATVRNSIVVGGRIGVRVPPNAPTNSLVVENCTFHSMSENGVNQAANGGSLMVTNTIVTGTVMNAFDNSGGTMVQQSNISGDATATGFGSMQNAVVGTLFVSTTVGAEDLHLDPGAAAVDMGTDLSTRFSDDIDGDLRPLGAKWDIGADEH